MRLRRLFKLDANRLLLKLRQTKIHSKTQNTNFGVETEITRDDALNRRKTGNKNYTAASQIMSMKYFAHRRRTVRSCHFKKQPTFIRVQY